MNGTGQTILSLAAFAVLSLLTLNANRLILVSFQSQLVSKQSVAAMAVGSSFLEEIQSKAFDEAVAANPLGGKFSQNQGRQLADLTAPKSLGPEAGEKYPFDDLDDYNGYSRKVWNPLFPDSLTLSAAVFYVRANEPWKTDTVRTGAKKIVINIVDVTVSKDTILKMAVQQVVYQ